MESNNPLVCDTADDTMNAVGSVLSLLATVVASRPLETLDGRPAEGLYYVLQSCIDALEAAGGQRGVNVMESIMSNEIRLKMRHQLPDDVLIHSARMFYPDVPESYATCAEALRRMRDKPCVDGHPQGEELGQWRLTDPVSIAYHAMTFVPPVLASNREYHSWHSRLRGMRKELMRAFLNR